MTREATFVLRRRGLPLGDFLNDAIQDGFEGLLRAKRGYRAETGTPLTTYARPFVQGAIIDALNRGRRADVSQLLLAGADARAADFVASHAVPEDASETPSSASLEVSKGAAGYAASLGLGYLGAIRKLDPEAALSARREHAAALRAIQQEFAKLPERDQRVLTLRDVEELPWEEVAKQLRAVRATVQRWRDQALLRLHEAVQRRDVMAMPRLPDDDDEEEE